MGWSLCQRGFRRHVVSVLAASLGFLAFSAGPAAASTLQATCSTFGSVLGSASSGDTIQLTGLCTGSEASFSLPSGVSNLTIEGAVSGTNGFNGAGVANPALSGTVDGLTLSGLTFEHYSQSSAVKVSAASTAANPFAFTDDAFTSDIGGNGNGGGGLAVAIHQTSCSFSGDAVTISGSTFSHDAATGTFSNDIRFGGGGGALVDLQCQSGASQTVQIADNRFIDDTAQTNSNGAQGGGLFVNGTALTNGSTVPITVTQTSNQFTGDALTGSTANGFFAGGGEFIIGARVTSVGDDFSQDTIPGPNGTGISWGAGLSTLGGGGCSGSPTISSTFTNLVATKDVIGAPSNNAQNVASTGAAIYAGCNATVGGSYHLALINSTISGNSASGTGAVGGVDGESGDVLTLENTILYGDTGAEIGGFGGGVNVSNSDVCAAGTSSPYTGTGNICANPKLVDVAAGDVHETAASPTLDRGNNAYLPGGVTTDYYGQPRIQYSSQTSPFTVDIGAAEFHLAKPSVSDCSRLQNVLNSAESGDVITLAALCTPTNSGSADGSFTLSPSSGVTILGAAGGTNGFDGGGSGGAANPALLGPGNGLTLRNLTFENYSLTNYAAAVGLSPAGGALPTLDRDRFVNNRSTVSAGGHAAGLFVQPSGKCSSPLRITNSTFSENTSVSTSPGATVLGGAAGFLFFCSPPHTAAMVFIHDTFSHNAIDTAGTPAFGAGLYAGNGYGVQLTAQQSGNVFSHNSIISTTSPASSQYDGGGEWLGEVNLTSTGDEYIGNSLPGPSGASAASEGAGLGVIRGACGSPTSPVSATATNLVAVDNTIGAPSAGGSVEGAGVYAGCAATQGTGGFNLTLINSTVTANSGPGGSGGVDGESTDHLIVQNAIVDGNSGSDIAGFGGGITVSHSDVCATGTATPYTGTANICAAPKLVSAATGNVRETSSSPTIDAGSDSFVPAGLRVDFYGQPRIVATRSCPALVDMGAAEFQTSKFCGNPRGTAKVLSEKPSTNSVLVTIGCTGVSAQSCAGTITMTTTETKRGSKVIAVSASGRDTKTKVIVGTATYTLKGGHRLTVQVKLNSTGVSLRNHFHSLPVTVTVFQSLAQGRRRTVSTEKQTIS